MSELTDEQLQDWLVRASHAGPWKPWQHGPTAEANADDVMAYLRGLYEAGGSGPVHTVHDGGPDGEALIVAVTGNGEHSKANAEFIAWSSPSNVSLVLSEVRQLRADVAAARQLADGLRAERDELRAADERTSAILGAAHGEHVKRAADVERLTRERDSALSARARLEGEVERVRPVVEAAIRMMDASRTLSDANHVSMDAYRMAWVRWDGECRGTVNVTKAYRAGTSVTKPRGVSPADLRELERLTAEMVEASEFDGHETIAGRVVSMVRGWVESCGLSIDDEETGRESDV